MRAAVMTRPGTPLDVRDDVELRAPGPGEVEVALHATGVCHTDLSVLEGRIPHPVPCVLGHEGAGAIAALGEGVDTLAVGQRVVLTWIASCGHCFFCRSGRPNLCPDAASNLTQRFTLDGTDLWAGIGTATFAERTVVPASMAIPLPDDVPIELAALLGCAVTTGVGAALNTAQVTPGSSVVVVGCGGVGINVVQGARIAGAAEIVAVDPVPEKREAARRFGATHSVDPEELAEVAPTLTSGLGFDFGFEAVGQPATIRAAWDATRRGGVTTVVGAGDADAQVAFNAFELFYFERQLRGCVYGSTNPALDVPRLLSLWRHGRLDLEGLVSRRGSLDDVNQAFETMRTGTEIRTVLDPRQ
jgi:S-(hydroxymethyl)glutathione dehydrogenase/alcohol dehydrogenase